MDDARARSAPDDAGAPGATAPLAEVRDDLAVLEALEREVADRAAHLRAVLPPALFRLAWALRDAEERHGLAERLLTQRRLVDDLLRALPAHAGTIRATARRHLGEGAATAGPG